MTDEVRAVIRAEIDAHRSAVALYVVVMCVVAGVLLVGVLSKWSQGTPTWQIAAVIFVLVLVVIPLRSARTRDLKRDLREGSYERTVGDLAIEEEWDYGYICKLSVSGRPLRAPWRRRSERPDFRSMWNMTVDHTTHAGLVLAIDDAQGVPVYRAPGYRLESLGRR